MYDTKTALRSEHLLSKSDRNFEFEKFFFEPWSGCFGTDYPVDMTPNLVTQRPFFVCQTQGSASAVLYKHIILLTLMDALTPERFRNEVGYARDEINLI